jgi:hypothetical protein
MAGVFKRKDSEAYEQSHHLRIAGPVGGKGPKHHGNGGLRAAGFKRNSVDLAVCPTTKSAADDADHAGVRNVGDLTAGLKQRAV